MRDALGELGKHAKLDICTCWFALSIYCFCGYTFLISHQVKGSWATFYLKSFELHKVAWYIFMICMGTSKPFPFVFGYFNNMNALKALISIIGEDIGVEESSIKHLVFDIMRGRRQISLWGSMMEILPINDGICRFCGRWTYLSTMIISLELMAISPNFLKIKSFFKTVKGPKSQTLNCEITRGYACMSREHCWSIHVSLIRWTKRQQ